MKLNHVATGYMCITNFECELEGDSQGTKVYPTIESLRKAQSCTGQCGIVEVEVKSVRVIQEANYANL